MKILDLSVSDFKDNPNISCLPRIDISQVGLFGKNQIHPFFLFLFCGLFRPGGQPDHFFILTVPKDLHPPVLQQFAAKFFSSGGKKIDSVLLIMDRTDIADLRGSFQIDRRKSEHTDVLQFLQTCF